jgi:osmotically-inducible protein OsmY
MALAILLPGCAPRTTVQKAARDQEVTTSLLWQYRQDPAGRFHDVTVTTVDGGITLEGRVNDAKAAQDALQIALAHSQNGPVVSKLHVRPR